MTAFLIGLLVGVAFGIAVFALIVGVLSFDNDPDEESIERWAEARRALGNPKNRW